MRRLDRARPAARRGDPQRAARVRSERGGGHPGGHGGGAAAAGAAGDAVQRPRVTDLVSRAAGGELVRVGVSQEDHALRLQPAPDDRVVGGDVALQDGARGGQRQPRDAVEILDAERDATQRRRPVALVAPASVGGPGRFARAILVQAHPGVDRVRRPVEGGRSAVSPRDRRQARLGQLDGRQPPLGEQGPGVAQTEIGGVAGDVLESCERHGISPRGCGPAFPVVPLRTHDDRMFSKRT